MQMGKTRAFFVALAALALAVAFVVPTVAEAKRCAGKHVTKPFKDGNHSSSGDKLVGTNRNDVIVGGNGADKIWGRGGRDRLCGGRSGDNLYGQGGRDILIGSPGDDRLEGGEQQDVLKGGIGSADRCFGGDGVDVITGCEN
jgi:Ca2+-binding RTX toxin-like protein